MNTSTIARESARVKFVSVLQHLVGTYKKHCPPAFAPGTAVAWRARGLTKSQQNARWTVKEVLDVDRTGYYEYGLVSPRDPRETYYARECDLSAVIN